MLAICGNDALRELSSPGKSGSFFYLTQDDRFMIKTVKKSEVKVSFYLFDLIFLAFTFLETNKHLCGIIGHNFHSIFLIKQQLEGDDS